MLDSAQTWFLLVNTSLLAWAWTLRFWGIEFRRAREWGLPRVIGLRRGPLPTTLTTSDGRRWVPETQEEAD